jgi:hypothetical protein
MKAKNTPDIRRRTFLSTSPFLLLGAASLHSAALAQEPAPKGPELRDQLSPEELELVKTSVMSEDMQNFWHKGHSCAETGLIVALRFLKKPEDLVWTAAGFGGGMGHQDLCGFLTSGVMALGLRAGDYSLEKNAAKMRCNQMVNEYWAWWTKTAPLHCSEIQKGGMNFNVCHRIGRLATAKLETLLKA